MGVYDRQIATAKRLIKAKGMSVIWRSKQDTTGGNDWRPNGSNHVDYPTNIVFIPKSSNTLAEIVTLIKGTDISTAKLTGLMPAVSFNPANRDLVIRPNDILNVKSYTPFAPNGDIILYYLEFEA